jgi:peroxiredoxin
LNLKKLVPVVLLAVLLIWGVYDVVNKNNINNEAVGKTNTNAEVITDKNEEVKIGLEKSNLSPDFELTTLDGKKVKLSDYRGKKVILNFWATWCPPCRAEMPDMEKFYSSYKDKDVVILGVNLANAERDQTTVKNFIKSYGITYPIPLDKENLAAEMYQVSAIPTSYIIDPQGIIIEKVVGPMDFETMKSLLSISN